MTLYPLYIDTQIEDALKPLIAEQLIQIRDKEKKVAENIDRVETINGSKVFNPVIKGSAICYQLTAKGKQYYYPIQYALITFKD